MSRDSLIRFLKKEWSGQKRLEVLFLIVKRLDGYLILDDTPIEKPHATTLEGIQYVYSSSLGRTVYGYCTVTLIWTDGNIRIPIGIRLWRKDRSKVDLALELLKPAIIRQTSCHRRRSILAIRFSQGSMRMREVIERSHYLDMSIVITALLGKTITFSDESGTKTC